MAIDAQTSPPYTVLGAGMVGVSCALALTRAGFKVTLIDREEPGNGASFGNAGLIHTGMPLPMSTPKTVRSMPKFLTDPASPLAIPWQRLLNLTPFLTHALFAARPSRVKEIASAMQVLLERSAGAHQDFARDAKAQSLFSTRGIIIAYDTERSFQAGRAETDFFAEYGATVEVLNNDLMRQMEPKLNRHYQWGYHLPDTSFTNNPGELTRAYFNQFMELGGTFVTDEVLDVTPSATGTSEVVGKVKTYSADRLVLAMGAHSKKIAARLGVRVPLESGRGYHLSFPGSENLLQGPVADGVKHIAATPMQGGVRIAGTMEFGGLEAEPNWARADLLRPLAKQLLPDLQMDGEQRWMGHRPMLPDSLPIIGPAPRFPNVLLAFGHGQLGLTMGPATGNIVADLAMGKEPDLDLSPYRPDRF